MHKYCFTILTVPRVSVLASSDAPSQDGVVKKQIFTLKSITSVSHMCGNYFRFFFLTRDPFLLFFHSFGLSVHAWISLHGTSANEMICQSNQSGVIRSVTAVLYGDDVPQSSRGRIMTRENDTKAPNYSETIR